MLWNVITSNDSKMEAKLQVYSGLHLKKMNKDRGVVIREVTECCIVLRLEFRDKIGIACVWASIDLFCVHGIGWVVARSLTQIDFFMQNKSFSSPWMPFQFYFRIPLNTIHRLGHSFPSNDMRRRRKSCLFPSVAAALSAACDSLLTNAIDPRVQSWSDLLASTFDNVDFSNSQ